MPLARAIRSFVATQAAIESVIAELKPNAGSSLRDAVDRIEVTTRINADRLVKLDAWQRAAWSYWDEVGLYETDEAGSCIWANRAYRRIVGREMSEIVGAGWVNGILADDRGEVVAAWRHAVADGRDFDLAYRMVDSGGVVIPVHGHASPLRDEAGKVLGFLGMVSPTLGRRAEDRKTRGESHE